MTAPASASIAASSAAACVRTIYPTRIDTFDLRQWGTLRFKQWLFNDTPICFTPDTVTRVARFIPPGAFAIDIGAYTGDTALPMALAAGPTGRVLAFEPGPAAFPLLAENVALNALPQLSIYNAAITATPGRFTFHYVNDGYINGGWSAALDAGPAGCGNPCACEVEGIVLTDRLERHYAAWLPRLSYVKIDTEGYDKEILKANRALFMRYRPVIEVEVYPFLSDAERADLKAAIRSLSYRWEGDESLFHAPPPAVINILCHPV